MRLRPLLYAVPLGVALVLLAVVIMFDSLAQERYLAEQRATVLSQMAVTRARLEAGLQARVHLLDGIVSYVSLNPEISDEQFGAMVRALLARQKGIRGMQLARNTVVSHVYPKQDETLRGLDLTKDESQGEAIRQALEKRSAVFNGPVEWHGGGRAFVNRVPIYISPEDGDPLSGDYWGLASLVIDYDALMTEAQLQGAPDNNLSYALRPIHEEDQFGACFLGDDALFDRQPVVMRVGAPATSWQLAALPAHGWPEMAPTTLWWRSAGVLLVMGGTLLAIVAVRTPVRLKDRVDEANRSLRSIQGRLEDMVHERTRELQVINQELERSRADLADAQHMARLGSWAWDVPNDELYCSDESYRIFGIPPRKTSTSLEAFYDAVHPEDRERLESTLNQMLQQGGRFEITHRILMADGAVRVVLSQGRVDRMDGERPTRVVGTVQDVTDRKVAEQQLLHLAYHDTLTALPNRALFRDRLEHAMARAQRTDQLVALLFLDVDRFKNVNDSLGHDQGDELLKQIAERLRTHVREEDTLARLGGDEFTIVLENLHHLDQVQIFCSKLLDLFRERFRVGEREMFVTVSIGVALYPSDGTTGEILMKNADTAMYRAKELGRNTVQFYSRDMGEHASARLELETDLRRAVENRDFTLHYQPIVDLRTGRVAALEALIRWDRPGYGPVSPLEFVPVAEETGMICAIGQWVAQTALEAVHHWRELPGQENLRMCINLSSRQFGEQRLPEFINSVLDHLDLPPSVLGLEITESMLLRDDPRVHAALRELRAMGCKIAVDDFGTGHSSLAYLKQFEIDVLKVDRGFVRDLPDDATDLAIVRAIAAMAKVLDLPVIAEGVETAEQYRIVSDCGCAMAQGFVLSRPLPADEVESLLPKEFSL